MADEIPMGRNDNQLAMWKRWQKEGDDDIRADLIEDLQPLIKKNIAQYSNSPLPYGAIQLKANAIVRDSLAKYDPSKGASVGTYITNSMKPISRYVQKYQNTKYLPSHLASQYGRFENAERELRDKLGRAPLDTEVAKHMKLNERQIRRIRLAKSPEVPVSLDEATEIRQKEQGVDVTARNKDKMYYLRTTLKDNDLKIFDMLTGMGDSKPVSDSGEIARRLKLPVSTVYSKVKRWRRQVM